MKRTIADAFDALRIIEQDSGTHFSVYGPVAPILLICVLRKAISRRIGAQENLEAFLEVSSWLNCMTYEINAVSLEAVIASVSKEAGDDKKALQNYFKTSISAFDEITHKGDKYKAKLDGIFREIEWDDTYLVFEEAIRLSVGYAIGDFELSNPSLAKLAKRLLNVNKGESFADFVCGVGLSSFVILQDETDVRVSLSDLNINSYALATIVCFLQNCKNNGTVQDTLCSTNFNSDELADKIFVDPPFRERLEPSFEYDGVQIKEASCSAVMKAATSLKEGGIAVITINSGFTYGSQFAIESVRKYLVDYGYLSAVISLPAMLPRRTGILTTILVISKRNNNKTVMIDLSKKNNDSPLFVYDRRYQALSFTDEGIETINSIVNNSESIPGISSIVDYSTIRDKEYVLLPNAYITDEENEKKTVSEIDAKIRDTIGEIQSLIGQLNSTV